MSAHEFTLVAATMLLMSLILWKWNKSLLVLLLLETMTSLIMAIFFLYSGLYLGFMIFMFVFFVSEALILLSSLYSSLRVTGSINSSFILS